MIEAAQPSFDAIEGALRATTERLACEFGRPRPDAPEWNELEWGVARAVAVMHGMSGALIRTIRWRGPPEWHGFLAGQREQISARFAIAGQLLARIDDATRRAGIPVVPLKGAALRMLGVHEADERPMGDIDLWARDADFQRLHATLAGIGYRHSFTTPRHTVFEPDRKPASIHFGEHADNPLKIEVHGLVAEMLPVRKVDITQSLFPATLMPGCNPYASDAALMRHLLLHTASNMRARAMRFAQLRDVALLAPRLTAADWADLCEWWMLPPLALVQRYFPGSIPPATLSAARDACGPWLAWHADRHRVTEVSWSNLRVEALPGIEWSRSLGEALRFAYRRVVPNVEARAQLLVQEKVQPHLGLAWYGLSQRRRILRWLMSQTPRVQTMYSVRAALDARGF